MVIAHNIAALNAYKSLGVGTGKANKSMEKLSSGYRINRAGDDAAGLSISEKMRSQIRGLNQASRNAQDGISMIQTAEGALNEEHSILQRMRELAVQSATDTNADEDRTSIQSELEQLTNEINRIGNTTEFNGMKILNGDKATALKDGVQAKTNAIDGLTYKAIEYGDDLNGVTVEHKEDTNAGADGTISYDKAGKKITVSFASGGANLDKIQELIESNEEIRNLISVSGTLGTFTDGSNAAFADGDAQVIDTDNDKSVYFHVGANQDQVINASFNDMRASELGITMSDTHYKDAATNTAQKKAFTSSATVNNGTSITAEEHALNISTREGANKAISRIDAAIKKVSNERSKYGAVQNRLEYTINNLNTSAENMQSAESRVRDVDMASEMMEMTKNNILQQAAQSMLIQANQRPQQALQLLQ